MFDPIKDSTNFHKDGLSMSEAKFLDWADALSWIDNRKDYGEIRGVALAPMKRRLYCVVYVDTKVSRRIISLRKANNREIDRYEEKTN
ncbi:MAG: BrnT family toxin [Burkholderiaceae bacterium]